MTDPSNAAPERRGATTAQVKGDINAGRTGDKVAGADVAASPLGTDDEAAGETFSSEEIARVRAREREGRPAGGSANAATPELQPDARLGPQRHLALAIAVGVVGAAVLAGLLIVAL